MNHARLCGRLVKVWEVLIALLAIGGLFCCVVPSAGHSIRSDPCHRAVVMSLLNVAMVPLLSFNSVLIQFTTNLHKIENM